MRQFLKYVLATIVGILVLWFVGFLLLIGVSSALSSSSDKRTTVKEKSVLKLDLDKPIQERSVDNPFEGFGGFGGSSDALGLIELKQSLKEAKDDDNIKGIYLQSESPMAGWASLEEVRNALIDFKKSKKFVYAYAETMSEKGYYLASVADKIYLNPAGDLEWNGLNAELTFFKGTLDKLGIKPEIFKVGDFKSAVEPFIRENMSDPNRLQVTSFLNSVNNHMLVNVAQSRGLRADSLKRYADNLTIQKPADALRTKLVTNVGYQDELESVIRKQLGVDEKKKINYVSASKYKGEDKGDESGSGSGSNRIAIIIASGDINSGKGDNNSIGSESIVAELRKARLDDKVKAIVLRVNSGGGSALASDVMYREVELAKKGEARYRFHVRLRGFGWLLHAHGLQQDRGPAQHHYGLHRRVFAPVQHREFLQRQTRRHLRSRQNEHQRRLPGRDARDDAVPETGTPAPDRTDLCRVYG